MSIEAILPLLLGGAIIGFAVTLMLLFNGRVTGISGILAGVLSKPKKDGLWRWTFLGGMIAGGIVMKSLRPELFLNTTGAGNLVVISAGLLVGYGTVMGSGCTSGHGVCGISRFSVRSLLATMTFMLFGFLAVLAVRFLAGGLT